MPTKLDKNIKCDCTASVDKKTKKMRVQISDSELNRNGVIIRSKGMRVKNYASNPVVLWAHDDSQLPIGRGSILRDGDKILADVEWADHDFAQTVKQLYEDGFLSAFSVGVDVVKYEPVYANDEFSHHDVTESDLLEFSAVPIPANKNALKQHVDEMEESDIKTRLCAAFEFETETEEAEKTEKTEEAEETEEAEKTEDKLVTSIEQIINEVVKDTVLQLTAKLSTFITDYAKEQEAEETEIDETETETETEETETEENEDEEDEEPEEAAASTDQIKRLEAAVESLTKIVKQLTQSGTSAVGFLETSNTDVDFENAKQKHAALGGLAGFAARLEKKHN